MVISPLRANSQSDGVTSENIPIKVTTVESDQTFIQKENEEESLLKANNEVAEQLYKHWIAERAELSRKRTQARAKGYTPCSCVSYAKYRTGYTFPVGNARNWPRNSLIPNEGGIVITNESSVGHVGYIIRVKVGEIDIIEANFHSCQVSSRTIKLDDPVIIGYWNPNK